MQRQTRQPANRNEVTPCAKIVAMSPKHVEDMYDAVIVGAGAAGLSAALGMLRSEQMQALKEAGIEPVGRPEVSVDAASETAGVTLTVKVAVMPEVKVGNYNGLTVEKTVHTVTDEAVDAELKRHCGQPRQRRKRRLALALLRHGQRRRLARRPGRGRTARQRGVGNRNRSGT